MLCQDRCALALLLCAVLRECQACKCDTTNDGRKCGSQSAEFRARCERPTHVVRCAIARASGFATRKVHCPEGLADRNSRGMVSDMGFSCHLTIVGPVVDVCMALPECGLGAACRIECPHMCTRAGSLGGLQIRPGTGARALATVSTSAHVAGGRLGPVKAKSKSKKSKPSHAHKADVCRRHQAWAVLAIWSVGLLTISN